LNPYLFGMVIDDLDDNISLNAPPVANLQWLFAALALRNAAQ
jgi:hypothetical protein